MMRRKKLWHNHFFREKDFPRWPIRRDRFSLSVWYNQIADAVHLYVGGNLDTRSIELNPISMNDSCLWWPIVWMSCMERASVLSGCWLLFWPLSRPRDVTEDSECLVRTGDLAVTSTIQILRCRENWCISWPLLLITYLFCNVDVLHVFCVVILKYIVQYF